MRRNNRNKLAKDQERVQTQIIRQGRLDKAVALLNSSRSQVGTVTVAERDIGGGIARSLGAFSTMGMEVVRTKLTYALTTVYQAPSADNTGAIYFTAGQGANFSDYATTFDQYRIVVAAVKFSPTSPNSTSNLSYIVPRLWTAIDHDDAIVPAGRSVVQSYGSCLESPPNTGVVRVTRPQVATAVYGGVTFNAYGAASMRWIDVASPAAQHYGVKYCIEAAAATQGSGTVYGYTIDVELYTEFRSTR